MCQQKLSEKRYDQMIQQYEARRRFRTANDEDLNGFPSNKYCFIGLFSLRDPPRIDVPDSVLKARRAHIRVAMITGDHPTTAKAIGKQVHILSSEISEKNGIDSFKIEQNEGDHSVLKLYCNEALLQQHVTDSNKRNPVKEPSWYKRCFSSCKNQFTESESVLKQEAEKEKIPYAIVVSFYFNSVNPGLYHLKKNIRLLALKSILWTILCGIGYCLIKN